MFRARFAAVRAIRGASPVAALMSPLRFAGDDFSHITRNMVWGLWNEGNLFSLSVPELTAFLRDHAKATVDPKAKKSALVRQLEEYMSAEQVSTGGVARSQPDTVASVTAELAAGEPDPKLSIVFEAKSNDLFDEADVYGDWGAESGFEDRKQLDFMELSAEKLQEAYLPLAPRAFQLLHDTTTGDVAIATFNAKKLPGQKNRKTSANTVVPVSADDANKIRIRRALKWCLTNLWQMNMAGELTIGAGKALYWRTVAKHNRNVLPIWTCQSHLYSTHPYAWFAIAHESNKSAVETFAMKHGMQLSQDTTTSYKVGVVKRDKELVDIELNDQGRCVRADRPWDRFLVSHFLRDTMPDLRYTVRARHPVKKRISDQYLESDIVRVGKDVAQSVLSPDLGIVTYCCERNIRKWSTRLGCGVKVDVVETTRTPLIVLRQGDEGVRLEYELIVQLPQQSEGIDIQGMSDELWTYAMEFARSLEDGMQGLEAHRMPSAAAFDLPIQ